MREVFPGAVGVISSFTAFSFVPSYEVTGGSAGIPDVVALGILGSLALGVVVGFIAEFVMRRFMD